MNPILVELVRERQSIISELEQLQIELRVIQRMIDKHTQPQSAEATKMFIHKNAKKPLQALKRIFNDSPTRKFTPSNLRDELESLRRQELLITKSDNLLFIVHSSLKALLSRNIIIKNLDDEPPTYQLFTTKNFQIHLREKFVNKKGD